MSKYSRVLQTGENQITQKYSSVHKANDLVKYKGQLDTIIAHSDGTIVWIQTGKKNNKVAVGNASYGNAVKIKHTNGYYTLYAHLSEVWVKLGQSVKKGHPIGYMGNTGRSFGAHLHFEVRNTKDQKINPTSYLNADLPNISKKSVTYRVYCKDHWYATVSNGATAGDQTNAISGLQVKGDTTIPYRVHTKGGKWLAEVSKWDDTNSGYAGIKGKPIDGIAIDKCKYRVKCKKYGWLPWVDGYNIKDANNGYAGMLGYEITAVEIKRK